jgi:hypothetical protein
MDICLDLSHNLETTLCVTKIASKRFITLTKISSQELIKKEKNYYTLKSVNSNVIIKRV